MFDPSEEPPIPLGQVPKMVSWLPCRRQGKRLHISTVFRWALRGVRGVRLETIRIGGTLCTSEEALVRFFQHLSGDGPAPPATPARTSRARRREIARAQRDLQRAGIV